MALGYEEIVKLLTKIKKDTPIKVVMGLEKVRIIEGLFQSYDKEQETMSILTYVPIKSKETRKDSQKDTLSVRLATLNIKVLYLKRVTVYDDMRMFDNIILTNPYALA